MEKTRRVTGGGGGGGGDFGEKAGRAFSAGGRCTLMGVEGGEGGICEERRDVNLYEVACMSAIGGCMPRVARGEDGILTWEQIEAVIRPKIYYDSQTALVCLENTSNMAGGTVYPTAQVENICRPPHPPGVKLHPARAPHFYAATPP